MQLSKSKTEAGPADETAEEIEDEMRRDLNTTNPQEQYLEVSGKKTTTADHMSTLPVSLEQAASSAKESMHQFIQHTRSASMPKVRVRSRGKEITRQRKKQHLLFQWTSLTSRMHPQP